MLAVSIVRDRYSGRTMARVMSLSFLVFLGIPILAPGELITQEIIDHILYAREKGCSLQGTADPHVDHIQILKDLT